MKPLRILLLIIAVACIITAAIIWSRRSAPGFVTPSECVDAFYNALLDQDAQGLERCCAPEFRSQASQLALEKKGISSWIEKGPAEFDGTTGFVCIEETRPGSDRAQRVRFRLQKAGGGWLIAGMHDAKPTKMNVSSGTPVGSVPNP